MSSAGTDDWVSPADDWVQPPQAPPQHIDPVALTPELKAQRPYIDPLINGSGPMSAPSRIAGAGVSGFEHGFGSEPLGLQYGTPADLALRRLDLTMNPDQAVQNPATRITDTLIRGGSALGDLILRGGMGAFAGAGAAGTQAAQETGIGKVLNPGRTDPQAREAGEEFGQIGGMALDAEPWARQANEAIRRPLAEAQHASAQQQAQRAADMGANVVVNGQRVPPSPGSPRGTLEALSQGQDPARRTAAAPAPQSAPAPNAVIGLKFPNQPSRRAVVREYFDGGQAVRLDFDNGQTGDFLTSDVMRDVTEPPPPLQAPPEQAGMGVPAPEPLTSPPFPDDWIAAPQRPTTAQGGLNPEALNAIDHADALERAAVNPRAMLSPEARDDMLREAARLRRLYGATPEADVGAGAYRHPLAGEPAADIGALARARTDNPEAFSGDYQHPLSDEPAADLGQLAVARQRRPDLYTGDYQRSPGADLARQAGIDPDFNHAVDDVRIARQPDPKYPTIFDAIRQMGGIRNDPEVRASMQDYKNPRFTKRVMHPDGMAPDDVRDLLQQEGWFGHYQNYQHLPPGARPGDDIQELYDAINREANGDPVYHPDSGAEAELRARAILDEELGRAGVASSDHPAVAARKLADFRKSAAADQFADQHEAAVDQQIDALSPQDRDQLETEHGYEPGADIGAEYEPTEEPPPAQPKYHVGDQVRLWMSGKNVTITKVLPGGRYETDLALDGINQVFHESSLDPISSAEEGVDFNGEPTATGRKEPAQNEGAEVSAVGPEDFGLREEDHPQGAEPAGSRGALPGETGQGVRTRFAFGDNGIARDPFPFQPSGSTHEFTPLNDEVQSYFRNAGVDPSDIVNAAPVAANYVAQRGLETGHENVVFIGTREPMASTVNVRNTVYWKDDTPQGRAMSDPQQHLVSFHNHPSSTPISVGDLSMFADPAHDAMIVTGHDGSWFGARRRLPAPANKDRAFQAIKDAYKAASTALQHVLTPHVTFRGALQIFHGAEAAMVWRDAILQSLGRAGVFDYDTSYRPEMTAEGHAIVEEGIRNGATAAARTLEHTAWDYSIDRLSRNDRRPEPVGFRDGVARLLGGIGPDATGAVRAGGEGGSAGLPSAPYRKPEQLRLLEDKRDYAVKPPRKLFRGIVTGEQERGELGLGTFHLGRGIYTSPDKSFARMYGPVTEIPVEQGWPRKPLVLRGAGGAGSLLSDWIFKNTSYKNIREFNKDWPDPGTFVRSKGYDGVIAGDEVVRYPDEPLSEDDRKYTEEPDAHGLPPGYTFKEGKGLGKGQWGVEGPDGALVWNLHPTKEIAARVAKQHLEQNAEQAGIQVSAGRRDGEIASKLLNGQDITDDELDHLGLHTRSSGFEYLSPVVQRLFNISRPKVREAMGDALRKYSTNSGVDKYAADPRKALRNAADFARRKEPQEPRYTEEPGGEGGVDAKGNPLPQLVMPGMERSAEQGAKAQSAEMNRVAAAKRAERRIMAKVPQKGAGPLFGDDGTGGQGSLFEDERGFRAPPFFSALTRGIEDIKQDRAPASQWSGIIDNLRNKGVKQDEIDWSGVKNWLAEQKGPVSKADLVQHLRENEVRVQEVEKRAPGYEPREDSHLIYGTPKGHTKYGQYALPGGQNYRELLLTLPAKDNVTRERTTNPPGWGGGPNENEGFVEHGNTGADYRSGHWDEPNVLAHVRFDDRTGPNGEKVLHIAEVQSDWHQAGRRKGYQPRDVATLEARRREIENKGRDATPTERQEWADIMNRLRPDTRDYEGNTGYRGVPDAPFKSTWHELAMKRILRLAAENGYDRVTWDTGATAADRFDLSKHLDALEWAQTQPGQFLIYGDQNGQARLQKDGVSAQDLPNVVGKELADKIIEQANSGKDGGKFTGLDLKVGGEGMKGFYDRILPQFVSKYTKKWGAKVGGMRLPTDDGSAGGGHYDPKLDRIVKDGGTPVHTVDITPAMRDSVMQGQGLFEDERTFPKNVTQAGDHIDDVASEMAADLHAAPPGTYERTLRRMGPQPGPEQFKDINIAQRIGTDPRVIASLDTPSARFWNAWRERDSTGHVLLNEARSAIPTFLRLDNAARSRVYGVEELDRIGNVVRSDDGRSVVARNDDTDMARHSQPGDVIRLTPEETKAYFERRKMFGQIWTRIMEGAARRLGWTGDWGPDIAANIQAVRARSSSGVTTRAERRSLERVADVLDAMEEQRRQAYVPLMRYGSYYIAVTPRAGTDAASLGGHPETAWFELVERPMLHDITGSKTTTGAVPNYAKPRIAELRSQFPAETHNIETGWMQQKPDILRSVGIPAIEKLLTVMEGGVFDQLRRDEIAGGASRTDARARAQTKYDAMFGAAVDELRNQMYESMKAGFKKRSRTVPGYDSDFDRTTGSYMNWTAHHVAEQLHGDDIESAWNGIQDSHPYDSIKQYWRRWRDYQEQPSNMLSRVGNQVQRAGFLWTMAGNPSSTSIILAHSPEMGLPTLAMGIPMRSAAKAFGGALTEAGKALRFDTERGAHIDISKMGANPAEKAFLQKMDREGFFHSTATDDMRNLNDDQSTLWGKAKPVLRRGLDIASSNISAADSANRIALSLASYRLASDPAALRRIDAAWRPNSQIWRDTVDKAGGKVTPDLLARFLVSEGAGEWGRTNRAEMGRGIGQAVFFLHGFQKRLLSSMFKFAKNTGPAGKIALTWMLGGLWAGAGLQGEPFVQDAENAADWAWKELTGHDPMLGYRMAAGLEDLGLGKVGSEIVMRGPVSTLTGVDLADRIGLGDVGTKFFDGVDALGTLPSIIASTFTGAQKRAASHQPAAAVAGALPAALRNPAMAQVERRHGIKSETGYTTYRTPKQISNFDTAVRTLGFRPTSEARQREFMDWHWRATHAKGTVPHNPIPKP